MTVGAQRVTGEIKEQRDQHRDHQQILVLISVQ